MKNQKSLEEILTAYNECVDKKNRQALYIEVIQTGLRLVKDIAYQAAVRSSIPAEDLMQVGSIGLIKATKFFKKDKNAKFKTYATHLIKGEIMHYMRDKASIIRSPRGETVEAILSLDQEEITIPASTDSLVDKITISNAIEKLPPDLKKIIELNYYEDMNQREISDALKISQMQVSRKLKQAMTRMYEVIKEV